MSNIIYQLGKYDFFLWVGGKLLEREEALLDVTEIVPPWRTNMS